MFFPTSKSVMQAAPVSMVHNGGGVTTLGPGIDNRALARFTETAAQQGAGLGPREAAMNWPRNKGIDGSAGRDDCFLKSGAQSVDLARSDFIIIDSLNRGEFGTGIGRQMNIPVGGVESDKESSTAPDGSAAIIPGLPRYLPPNYYLDATRAVVRWAKPEDKRHY